MDVRERVYILNAIGKKLEGKRSSFLKAFADDIGVPLKIGEKEIDFTVKHLTTMEEEVPFVEGRSPYGAVGIIMPYDAPTMMFARAVGAAFLGGNRVYVSFSSWTPRVRDLMAEIVESVGVEREISINTELDNRAFGKWCAECEHIRAFFISGASEVGSIYEKYVYSGNFDKLIFAGPGGMPAVCILPGADVEKAAVFTAKRAFLNGGQYCTTIKKALVVDELFDDFVNMLIDEVSKIKVGDPMDKSVDYGPIKVTRTKKLFLRALGEIKGKVVLGGTLEGDFIKPTVVIADSIPDLELFGPYLAVKKLSNKEEVINELCSTKYPFICYIFGNVSEADRKKISQVFGMYHFNPKFVFLPLRAPFGGKKASGWVLERKGDVITKKDGALVYAVEFTRSS